MSHLPILGNLLKNQLVYQKVNWFPDEWTSVKVLLWFSFKSVSIFGLVWKTLRDQRPKPHDLAKIKTMDFIAKNHSFCGFWVELRSKTVVFALSATQNLLKLQEPWFSAKNCSFCWFWVELRSKTVVFSSWREHSGGYQGEQKIGWWPYPYP